MRLLLCVFCVAAVVVVVVSDRAAAAAAAAAATSQVYNGGFDVLAVGQMRMQDTMQFPDDMTTEMRRLYILHGLKRDQYYVIHLSYLGSPSMDYRLHLTRLPRSVLEKPLQPVPGHRQLADTAILLAKTHVDEIVFDYVGGDGDVDDGTAVILGDDSHNNNLVPVLEVRGRRNAFPFHPEKWINFSYNLRIDAIGSNEGLTIVVMEHVMIVTTTVIIVVAFIVPWLVASLAGNAPKPGPRRDFIIFLQDR